jgi:hypothetical protein
LPLSLSHFDRLSSSQRYERTVCREKSFSARKRSIISIVSPVRDFLLISILRHFSLLSQFSGSFAMEDLEKSLLPLKIVFYVSLSAFIVVFVLMVALTLKVLAL